MSTTRIVEFEDVTAGIAVPVALGTLRFFAAERIFDPLERRTFRSIDEVVRAARDRLARSGSPRWPSERRVADAVGKPVAPGPSGLSL